MTTSRFRALALGFSLLSLTTAALAQEDARPRDYGSRILAKCDDLDPKTEGPEMLKLLRTVPPADSLYERVLMQQIEAELDNDLFADLLETCELGIREKGELEHVFHLEKVIALNGLKRFDEALTYADYCSQRYPGNFQCANLKAVVYNDHGDHAKALELYKANAIRFPFRPEAHVALAQMARAEGRIAQAALCYSMALVVSYGGPKDERNLVALDQLLGGNSETDPQGVDLDQGDDFADLDLILKNKVAMEKKYKVKPDLPYPTCRQSHLLFSSLLKNTPGDGFWSRYYVPFFKRLMQDQLFEGFVYNAINNSSNPDVNGVARKKAGDIKLFRDRSAALVMELFQTYPDSTGGTPVQHWYNENGDMLAVGKGDSKTNSYTGPWTYYRNNGAVSSRGELGSDSKRTGEWHELYSNGKVRKVATYQNGEEEGLMQTYYVTGALQDSVGMKNGKAVGMYHHHLVNGTLKYAKTMVNDEFEGEVTSWFPCGAVEDHYTVVKSQPDGAATSYHANGKTQYTGTYTKGERTGLHTTYYADGTKESEYTYTTGKSNGPCKEWWPNGQLKLEGQRANGDWTGPFKEYDEDGLLLREGQRDEKGNLTGVVKEYSSGWLHLEQEFSRGQLVRYRYTDKTGKVQSEGERKKGKFQFVGYSEEGFKASEGTYLDEGLKEGPWKYYYEDGTVSSEENYVKGELQGAQRDNWKNGKLLREYQYEGTKRNGPYKQYYIDGKPQYIGWLQDGKLNGTYRQYLPDGTLIADEYYVDGDRDGWQTYYDPEGKLDNIQRIVDGQMLEKYRYDANGKQIQYYLLQPGVTTYREVYADGRTQCEFAMVNGSYHGKATWYYPNGKVNVEGQYVNGHRDGLWKGWYDNGKQRFEHHYANGDQVGTDREWYRDGTMSSQADYAYDQLNGSYRFNERNGKPSVERGYLHGKMHGIAKSYTYDGGLQIVRFYDHDRLIGYALPGNDGKYGDTIPITSGVIELKPLFPNGKPAREFRYRNGEVDGTYKSYHPNGQLMEECAYEVDEEVGPDKEYYANGNLRESSEYVDGLRHGTYSLYSESGKLVEQATYRYGQLHGEYKVWDASGKLQSTALYRDDEMIEIH